MSSTRTFLRFAVVIAALAGAGFAVVQAVGGPEQTPARYRTDAATRGPIEAAVLATGTLAPGRHRAGGQPDLRPDHRARGRLQLSRDEGPGDRPPRSGELPRQARPGGGGPRGGRGDDQRQGGGDGGRPRWTCAPPAMRSPTPSRPTTAPDACRSPATPPSASCSSTPSAACRPRRRSARRRRRSAWPRPTSPSPAPRSSRSARRSPSPAPTSTAR